MRPFLAQAKPEPAPAPAPRDSREDFMPGDPLGTRLGGGSISATASQNGRIAVLSRSAAEPGPSLDERNRARRVELIIVLLVVAAVAVAAAWFYWRRGHINFAGQGFNRE